MAYEPSVLRRATARLEETRRRRGEEQAARQREIYRRIPRVAEIERQLRRTIVGIIAASLRSGEDPAPAIESVREKNCLLYTSDAADE